MGENLDAVMNAPISTSTRYACRQPYRWALSACTCALLLGACYQWTDNLQGRPRYLASYIDSHYQDLGQQFVTPMTRDEFREQLGKTRVLFLGDHHRDPGLHAEILALLAWISDQGRRPMLGIEAIGIQDDAALQEFLAGDIDLAPLRRRITDRWPESWLDNPEVDYRFYRRLLQTARAHRIPIFALEPTPRHSLSARDTLIAGNIRHALRLHPDHLMVVVVGHAHLLGRGHLVGRVGAPALAIAARFSPTLSREAAEHRQIARSSFLQTERGVLFFPSTPVEAAADGSPK